MISDKIQKTEKLEFMTLTGDMAQFIKKLFVLDGCAVALLNYEEEIPNDTEVHFILLSRVRDTWSINGSSYCSDMMVSFQKCMSAAMEYMEANCEKGFQFSKDSNKYVTTFHWRKSLTDVLED